MPKLIVIGAGAAGFFCAVNAARLNSGLSITLLEKTNKMLSKVKVSGGGRCNLTHACFQISDMIPNYPRGGNFLRKSFGHFFTTDTIKWFEDRGVKLKTEEDGRVFPQSDSSHTITNCLMQEANQYGVEILMNRDVEGLEKNEEWKIILKDGKTLKADYVCVANGGSSKGSSYEWLSRLGYEIVPPVPSLFTFNIPHHPISTLMGVSVEKARIRISGTKLAAEGPVLVTHWGLSGPAVLRLSAFAARDLAEKQYQFEVGVNWCPAFTEVSMRETMQTIRRENGSQKMNNRNPFQLPQRLWEFLLREAGLTESIRWADLPAKSQNKLILLLTAHPFEVKGKTTFKEEFVTAGGVSLNYIDPLTMQGRLHAALFFAGEVMDVDGVTGGFNFQHAWTSGYLAAREIARQAI